MTHIKDKEMINTNKAVFVKFPANMSTGTASIYISFPVKEIHVRGVDIDWGQDYSAVMFTSSLVNSGPIGGGYCGIHSDLSTSIKKLRYIFREPIDVNGTYQFTYQLIDTDGGAIYPDIFYGNVCFTLEFIGYV